MTIADNQEKTVYGLVVYQRLSWSKEINNATVLINLIRVMKKTSQMKLKKYKINAVII